MKTDIIPDGWVEWEDKIKGHMKDLEHFSHDKPWIVGDLLNWGFDRFGELAAQVIPEQAAGTLANWCRTAKRWEIKRRVYHLPHSYYQDTARFEPSDQDIVMTKVVEENMNRSDMREYLRDIRLVEPRNPQESFIDKIYRLYNDWSGSHGLDKNIDEFLRWVHDVERR